MLLYQSWNKSKLQLRNALIFFYLSICLISCLHSNPFSPSSFVLCGQVPQEGGQIADQCLQPACIWLGWEDGTTRFCEVSSEKILRRCTIFPGTIKGFRNTNEMNGKIQGYLLKQKAIYTHIMSALSSKISPILLFPSLIFTLSFSYLLSYFLALPLVWTHLQWHHWSLCHTCSSPRGCTSQSRVWTQQKWWSWHSFQIQISGCS